MEKAKKKKHSSTESTAPVIAFEMCLVFSFIFEKRFHSVAQVGLDFFFIFLPLPPKVLSLGIHHKTQQWVPFHMHHVYIWLDIHFKEL